MSKYFVIPEGIGKITAKQFNDLLSPYLQNMAVDLAKQYKTNHKFLIGTFIRAGYFRNICALVVKDFETNISEYQEDEKISLYVEKLTGITTSEKEILKRTLVMIKKIVNA